MRESEHQAGPVGTFGEKKIPTIRELGDKNAVVVECKEIGECGGY